VCLSRQELAEQVNSYVWDHYQKRTELDGNYLGKLERGIVRWPGRMYREALRSILSVPTDDALGFADPRSTVVKLVDVDHTLDRRTAALGLGGLAMSALAPAAAFLEGGEPTQLPARVGATDIEHIRTASRVVQSWGRTYGGGGLAREAAMGQLRWANNLLKATCPARLRPELFSAVGDLAEVAGYIAEDAGAPEQAARVYRFALDCVEKADDWPLRAEILSSMAGQAIRAGRPDEGLTLAEQGLVRSDRLTVAGRSMLHTDRGLALARMHRGSETLSAIGTADDHFAHFTPDNEPSFLAAYYNPARYASLAGQPLADLAILLGSDPRAATDRLTAAAAGHNNSNRSRAVCLAKLACLTMATGDPIQAVTIGHEALDAARTIRSRQATDHLRELARHTTRHPKIDEVTTLNQRITTALAC
jgi:hypothetical protein